MSSLHLLYPRVADALTHATGLSCDVGDPQARREPPYLFAWGPVPVDEATEGSEALRATQIEGFVQVVAKNVPEVNKETSQVIAALQDLVVSIPGWRTFPITVKYARPAQTDPSVVEPATNLRAAWVTVAFDFQASKEGD